MTPQAIEEFYRSGVGEIRRITAVLERHFGPVRPSRAVDFGCGPGRLAFAMAAHAEHVYGLDVSPGMLSHGLRRKVDQRIQNIDFVSELPADVRLDWINSYIVFQHIPPARGYVILENLLRRLNQGGVVSLQVTYYHGPSHEMTLMRELGAYAYDGVNVRLLAPAAIKDVGAMSMYDYDLNNVFRLLHEFGVNDCYLEQTDHGGCHGMWIYGRKT